jgi:hypothetical protein
MANISKFGIPVTTAPFEVKIKGFQEVVHAGHDEQGDMCFWAIVNPDMPEESWTFLIVQDGTVFDSTKWAHMLSFDADLTGGTAMHLLRPIQQWGVQPGASMDDDKPLTPSANTMRHMIGDLRKHLRSAGILAHALAPAFTERGVGVLQEQLSEMEQDIKRLMRENGIPEDSVTRGYEDESH